MHHPSTKIHHRKQGHIQQNHKSAIMTLAITTMAPNDVNTMFRSHTNPERFTCDLSNMLMNDPVCSPQGYVFERKRILRHIKKNGEKCPISGQPLRTCDLNPDNKLLQEILYWQRKNNSISPPPPPPAGGSKDHTPTSRTRKSLVREDSFRDEAPVQPRRRSRCDKTMSLDESAHDASPAVPLRKNSDDHFLKLCQSSLMKPSCCKMDRSTALSELMKSFSLTGDSCSSDGSDDDDILISPDSILSVLDEVEQTISLDLLQ